MSNLVCPKCHGPMRSYERSGVHVDQCTDCRGIFLDRGELEHLIDAETAFAARAAPPQPAAPLPPAPEPGFGMPQRGWDRDWSHDDSHDGYGRGRPRKRRKSFLEDLFD